MLGNISNKLMQGIFLNALEMTLVCILVLALFFTVFILLTMLLSFVAKSRPQKVSIAADQNLADQYSLKHKKIIIKNQLPISSTGEQNQASINVDTLTAISKAIERHQYIKK